MAGQLDCSDQYRSIRSTRDRRFRYCTGSDTRCPPFPSRPIPYLGGSKILALLSAHPEVAERYAHLLTPGHVIAVLRQCLLDEQASIAEVLQSLIIRQFKEQQF